MHWGGVALRADHLFAAVPVVLAASAADARFLPPEGQPIRQVLTEERIEASGTRRFVSEREIVFTRTETGWRARVTIVADNNGGGDAGAMFGAGLAGLKGQPIVFELDREGTVVAIGDEDAIWAKFCDAIEGMARGTRALDAQRARNLQALVAPFRAMPPPRRRALLGAMISALIAGPLANRRPGTQPITLPARDAQGTTIALPGKETVAMTSGALTIDSSAEGDVGAAHLVVTRREKVDAARGLILESQTRRDTVVGAGAAARRSQATISNSISLKVS